MVTLRLIPASNDARSLLLFRSIWTGFVLWLPYTRALLCFFVFNQPHLPRPSFNFRSTDVRLALVSRYPTPGSRQSLVIENYVSSGLTELLKFRILPGRMFRTNLTKGNLSNLLAFVELIDYKIDVFRKNSATNFNQRMFHDTRVNSDQSEDNIQNIFAVTPNKLIPRIVRIFQ